MIGLPSGLERVRWNEFGLFADAFKDAEDARAAGAGVIVIFEHQSRSTLRQHETVAVLGERL